MARTMSSPAPGRKPGWAPTFSATRTLSPPARFARYIARSASRSSVSASAPALATPTLATLCAPAW
ncbi:hypothetical protein ACFPIJ_03580 [Dactylosporangium cerinum]|uniref:Uncharacterized protein n=1 Tax=Dactylosporangium cerinum TaxID=1434730 RepID=A0ABV9VMW3_9ACTN